MQKTHEPPPMVLPLRSTPTCRRMGRPKYIGAGPRRAIGQQTTSWRDLPTYASPAVGLIHASIEAGSSKNLNKSSLLMYVHSRMHVRSWRCKREPVFESGRRLWRWLRSWSGGLIRRASRSTSPSRCASRRPTTFTWVRATHRTRATSTSCHSGELSGPGRLWAVDLVAIGLLR